MRNLSYFMRETKEEIVKVKAPESFKDENGNVIDMEVKLLSNQHINKIREKYRRRSIALDKKGNPYISNGEVAFKTEDNFSKFLRHILAEAIVYPDMRSKEIMEFYNCYDVSEIPLRVFSDMDEYNYVFKTVLTLHELAQNMGRVIPLASAYNVEMDNLSAAYAEMTKNGIATAESTTYIKSMLNELGSSGSEVSKVLTEQTGQSFAQLMQDG